MADHVTPNLPSRDFDVTEAFYAKLGFATSWKDRGWMILQRGGLQLEFFPYPDLDPATSSFGCCLRLDDLDAMVALVNAARPGKKAPAGRAKAPQLEASGLRIGYLIDSDCTLVQLIQNPD